MANPSPNPNPNPRRNSYSNTVNSDNSSRLMNFFKRPHAFPFLLSVFLLLTWLSFRLQHSSHFSPSSRELHKAKEKLSSKDDDDRKANLVRFKSDLPSLILKDKRGWLLNPVSLALNSGVKGGAVSCVSLHVGQIQPGNMRGNHRHYTTNETFVLWGAKTKFRGKKKIRKVLQFCLQHSPARYKAPKCGKLTYICFSRHMLH
ncbi:RmlC-type cupin [Melia azedarach]|uniref:RmlC-type cupin n=1 Tax=Melia azedarach TaxID=155640 RepID=A0ACC1X5V5_MELAZ|nr:RmlC-type cupin [Melia azedarach]